MRLRWVLDKAAKTDLLPLSHDISEARKNRHNRHNSYNGKLIGNHTQAFNWSLPISMSVMHHLGLFRRSIAVNSRMKMYVDACYQRQEETDGSVVFVYKFAGWRPMSPNLDFKLTIFFNVKYLENGTRQSFSYSSNSVGEPKTI